MPRDLACVARFESMDRPGTCPRRKALLVPVGLQEMLEKCPVRRPLDWTDENADLVANRGIEAIMRLMGRGIAEATANRLLVKVAPGDTEGLLQAIHKAEVEHARTRRFWGWTLPIRPWWPASVSIVGAWRQPARLSRNTPAAAAREDEQRRTGEPGVPMPTRMVTVESTKPVLRASWGKSVMCL